MASTKSWESLSCKKTLMPETFWNTLVPQQIFLGNLRKQETIRRKILKKFPLHLLSLLDSWTSLKHRKVHLRKISVLWNKNVPMENRDTFQPVLCVKIFDAGIFMQQKREGSPHKFFRYCETKDISWKIATLPPSFSQTNRNEIIFETRKASPTNCFGTVRQKKLHRKIWMSLPLFDCKFSIPDNF